MIIQTCLNRGFAFAPMIFIPARLKTHSKEYLVKVSHETIHRDRQGWFPIVWFVKYFCSKKFRLQEEKLAFTAQIKTMKFYKMPINKEQIAWSMANEYYDMISYNDAMKLVEGII